MELLCLSNDAPIIVYIDNNDTHGITLLVTYVAHIKQRYKIGSRLLYV